MSVAAAVHHGPAGPVRLGMVLFIVSEAMLFAALFAAYFSLRGTSAAWPPTPGVERPELTLVTLNTLLLLGSGVTMQLAVGAVRRDRRARARRLLGVTLMLGAAFLAIQGVEFAHNKFGIGDAGAFGSTFYILTGFHGLHVLCGLLAIGALFHRAARGVLTPADEPATDAVSYYWHFVDVVWLVLFATVYVL